MDPGSAWRPSHRLMIVQGRTREPSPPERGHTSFAGPIHLLATWLRRFRLGRWAERRMEMRRGDTARQVRPVRARDDAIKAGAADANLQVSGYRSSMRARMTNTQSILAISAGDFRRGPGGD